MQFRCTVVLLDDSVDELIVVLLEDSVDEPGADPSGSLVVLLDDSVEEPGSLFEFDPRIVE